MLWSEMEELVMRIPHRFRSILAAVGVWLVTFTPAVGSTDPADWPMYNHDPAGWRFNAAEKTLSPANAGKLVEK
jgi:hypothetical protein